MKRLWIIILLLCLCLEMEARKVTVHAVNQPAAQVFRSIVEQTGMNFVYSSDLLRNTRVSVDVKDETLKKALSKMFHDTDIEFKIKGRNIILKKKPMKPVSSPGRIKTQLRHSVTDSVREPTMLQEVVVIPPLTDRT